MRLSRAGAVRKAASWFASTGLVGGLMRLRLAGGAGDGRAVGGHACDEGGDRGQVEVFAHVGDFAPANSHLHDAVVVVERAVCGDTAIAPPRIDAGVPWRPGNEDVVHRERKVGHVAQAFVEKVLQVGADPSLASHRTWFPGAICSTSSAHPVDLPRPRRVSAPMLVIGAALDGAITPREVHANATAYGATADMFPGMGHDMTLESGWAAVAEHIDAWLVQRDM